MGYKDPQGFFGGEETNKKIVNTRPDERTTVKRTADFRPKRREI